MATCQLCLNQCSFEDKGDSSNYMYQIDSCKHSFCIDCLRLYLKYQIVESRVSISCPQCSEKMHPNDIYELLKGADSLLYRQLNEAVSNNEQSATLIHKYEEFMVRRVMVTIPDARWCPAPDCTYAVIASGCANCPQLFCMRPGCNTSFCYHCKQYWHPNLTCEDAAIKNNQSSISAILSNIEGVGVGSGVMPTNRLIRSLLQRSNSHISTGSSNAALNLGPASSMARSATAEFLKDEIKRCPKCQALIVKMDDGSCNHITCAVCGCEFCWLCMKEISDLHYLSPSGCTFWGKKPWSRKKKILWQLGILIGAPVGIALIAGVAVPGKYLDVESNTFEFFKFLFYDLYEIRFETFRYNLKQNTSLNKKCFSRFIKMQLAKTFKRIDSL